MGSWNPVLYKLQKKGPNTYFPKFLKSRETSLSLDQDFRDSEFVLQDMAKQAILSIYRLGKRLRHD